MRLVLIGVSLLSLLAPVASYGDQLDEVSQRPEGVFVSVDGAKKTVTIYKVDKMNPLLKNSASLTAAERVALGESEAARVARPENVVGRLTATVAELDKDGSSPACWFGGWGSGWGYGGGWGGYSLGYSSYWYNPWYYPSYVSYGYGGYRYGYGCGGYGYGGYRGYGYGWYW
jgi:hypothetical protein